MERKIWNKHGFHNFPIGMQPNYNFKNEDAFSAFWEGVNAQQETCDTESSDLDPWNSASLALERKADGVESERNLLDVEQGREPGKDIYTPVQGGSEKQSLNGTGFVGASPTEEQFGVINRERGLPLGLSNTTKKDQTRGFWGDLIGAIEHVVTFGLEGDEETPGPDTSIVDLEPTVDIPIDVGTLPGKAELSWSYARLMTRPRPIQTVQWAATASYGDSLYFDSMEEMIRKFDPYINTVIAQFKYFRFKNAIIRVFMQTNQFYAGILRAIWVPGTSNIVGNIKTILNTGKGVELFAAQGEQGCFVIPWIYPRTWYDVSVLREENPLYNTFLSMGSLVIAILAPLAAPEGNAQTIPVTINLSFEGCEFAVPRRADSAVPAIVGTVVNDPLEGAEEEMYYYPTTSRHNDTYSAASLTPGMIKTSSHADLKDGHEMNVSYLGAIWAVADVFQIAATDAPGHVLWTQDISMEMILDKANAVAIDPHPISVIAQQAAFWAGSQCYKILISKNAFQKAKIVVGYIPSTDALPTTVSRLMEYPYILWEIGESNVLEFRVAEMRDKSLMLTGRYEQAKVTPPNPNTALSISPGRVQMMVYSPFVSPVGSPQTAEIVVFKSYYPGDLDGAHRLRLFGPMVGLNWNRKTNAPTTALLEAGSTMQSFWLNSTRVMVLGEDIQDSAKVHTDAEEIYGMSQFLRRSQATIFYKDDNTDPVPPIPIRMNYLLPNFGAFSAVKYLPDQHLQRMSTMFSYWGGGLQAMIVSNTDITQIRQVPQPCASYANQVGFGVNPAFGATSGLMLASGGAQTSSVSLGNIGLNDFFTIGSDSDSFDDYGSQVVIDSYDSVQQRYASKTIMYLSAHDDFWFGGYKFVNRLDYNTIVTREATDGKFPVLSPTVEETPIPSPPSEPMFLTQDQLAAQRLQNLRILRNATIATGRLEGSESSDSSGSEQKGEKRKYKTSLTLKDPATYELFPTLKYKWRDIGESVKKLEACVDSIIHNLKREGENWMPIPPKAEEARTQFLHVARLFKNHLVLLNTDLHLCDMEFKERLPARYKPEDTSGWYLIQDDEHQGWELHRMATELTQRTESLKKSFGLLTHLDFGKFVFLEKSFGELVPIARIVHHTSKHYEVDFRESFDVIPICRHCNEAWCSKGHQEEGGPDSMVLWWIQWHGYVGVPESNNNNEGFVLEQGIGELVVNDPLEGSDSGASNSGASFRSVAQAPSAASFVGAPRGVLIEDGSDETASDTDEPPDEGFFRNVTRIPADARKAVYQLSKKLDKVMRKSSKRIDRLSVKMEETLIKFQNTSTSVDERIQENSEDLLSLTTMIRTQLERVLGHVPSMSDVSLAVILLIDLIESLYQNEKVKWTTFVLKLGAVLALRSNLIGALFAYVSGRDDSSNQSAEGVLEAVDPMKGITAAISVAVIAIGLKQSGADDFSNVKAKTVFERIAIRGRELNNIKMGVSTLAVTFGYVQAVIVDALNEYVLTEPMEGGGAKNWEILEEILSLTREFGRLAEAENLSKLPYAGKEKSEFFAAHKRFTVLRNKVMSATIERDTYMKFQILERLIIRLESGAMDNYSAEEYRWDPLHICFVGETAIGKSALIARIAKVLMDSQHEDPNQPRIYPVSPGLKHHDGYCGQRCITIDDIDAIEDPEVIHSYMLQKSNNPLVMPMAHLLKKGMYFRSDLMVSSSNVLSPKPKCMPHPEAYTRRRDITLRVTFNDPGKVKNYDYSHASFELIDNRSGITPQRFRKLTYREVVGFLVPAYSTHLINQAKLARASSLKCQERRIYDYGRPLYGAVSAFVGNMADNDIQTSQNFSGRPGDSLMGDLIVPVNQSSSFAEDYPNFYTQVLEEEQREWDELRAGIEEEAGTSASAFARWARGSMEAGEVEQRSPDEPRDEEYFEYNWMQEGDALRVQNDTVPAFANALTMATEWGIKSENGRAYFFLSLDGQDHIFDHLPLTREGATLVLRMMNSNSLHNRMSEDMLKAYALNPREFEKYTNKVRATLEDLVNFGEPNKSDDNPFMTRRGFVDFFITQNMSVDIQNFLKDKFVANNFVTRTNLKVARIVSRPRRFVEGILDQLVQGLQTEEVIAFEIQRSLMMSFMLFAMAPTIGFAFLKRYVTRGWFWIWKRFSGSKPWLCWFIYMAPMITIPITLALIAGAGLLAVLGIRTVRQWWSNRSTERNLIEGEAMPIQTHAHKDLADDGKPYIHVHLCEEPNCGDAFTHRHKKRSEEESKKYPHRCPRCRIKIMKQVQQAMAGGTTHVDYFPDESELDPEEAQLEHRGYPSSKGKRVPRTRLQLQAKTRSVRIEAREFNDVVGPDGKLTTEAQHELSELQGDLFEFTQEEQETLRNVYFAAALKHHMSPPSVKETYQRVKRLIASELAVWEKATKPIKEKMLEKALTESWTNVTKNDKFPKSAFNPPMICDVAGLAEPLEEEEGQLQSNDQGAMTVMNKVFLNSGTVQFGATTLGYIGIGELKILTTAHLVRGERHHQYYPLTIRRGDINYSVTVERKRMHFAPELFSEQLKRKVQVDLLVIDLCDNPKIMPFANIRTHFIRGTDLDLVLGSDGELCVRDNLRRGHTLIVSATKIEPVVNRVYESGFVGCKMWKYNAKTRPGYCGSPLLVHNSSIPNKIIGIHQASLGPGTGVGFAMVVTFEMINELSGPQTYINGPQLEDLIADSQLEGMDIYSMPEHAPTGRYIILGELPRTCGTTLKTDLRPSPLFDHPFVHTSEPAVLKKSDPRNLSGNPPLAAGLQKFDQETGDWNLADRIKTREFLLQEMLKDESYQGPKRLLTTSEAINGIAGHVEPINMRTSPGYPFVTTRPKGKIGKEHCFEVVGETREGAPLYQPTQELQETIDYIERAAKDDNKVVRNYFMDWPKDERRPIEKVAIGKTRLFNIHTVAWLIVCKKHFGAFSAAFMKARFRIGSALGMNMHGPEVTQLVDTLLEVGNNISDGDVEKWDGGYDYETAYDIVWVATNWLKHYLIQCDYYETMTVGLSLIWRVHICGRVVYICTIGMPSGHFLTAVGNTGGHILRNLRVFLECIRNVLDRMVEQGRPKEEILEWIKLLQLPTLREHLRYVIGGDDQLQSVSDYIAAEISPTDIADVWKSHGIGFIPPQKQAGLGFGDWSDIEHVQFFKCRFNLDTEIGNRWHMAMELLPTKELINWVRTGATPYDALQSNIRDFQHFAYAHGRKVFEEVTQEVRTAAEEKQLYFNYATFEDFDYEWRYEHELTGFSVPLIPQQ